MNDLIDRQILKADLLCGDNAEHDYCFPCKKILERIDNQPSARPKPFVDADKLKRCRFEYINACKIVARPTPDTSKSDIYDAHAVIKALHPIFGDVEF